MPFFVDRGCFFDTILVLLLLMKLPQIDCTSATLMLQP